MVYNYFEIIYWYVSYFKFFLNLVFMDGLYGFELCIMGIKKVYVFIYKYVNILKK